MDLERILAGRPAVAAPPSVAGKAGNHEQPLVKAAAQGGPMADPAEAAPAPVQGRNGGGGLSDRQGGSPAPGGQAADSPRNDSAPGGPRGAMDNDYPPPPPPWQTDKVRQWIAATERCPRCGCRLWDSYGIHNGQSIRAECRGCRFVCFPVWYGRWIGDN